MHCRVLEILIREFGKSTIAMSQNDHVMCPDTTIQNHEQALGACVRPQLG